MNWEYVDSGQEEVIMKGRGVSSGLALARVYVNARGFSAPDIYEISEDEIEAELKDFREAISETKTQLEEIKARVSELSGDKESQIFDAHTLLLEDKTLFKKVEKELRERLVNVSYCYYAVIQGYMEALRRVNDPYLAERAVDIEDVAMRLLDNLLKVTDHEPEVEEDHILVSYDLTPSDTVKMDRQKTLGFATEQGSYTSHTAILARSLGIPAIVGLESAVLTVPGLANCIIDGAQGLLIVHPTRKTLEKYKQLYIEQQNIKGDLKKQCAHESKTADGHRITLSANVEFTYEVDTLLKNGAEGIGLYRTEFFLLENQEEMPNEEVQTELYSNVTKQVSPNMSIFRTIDSGGDKMSGEQLIEPEPNPFLGWRGIRFSLARPKVFKTQLRALLRSSVHGEIGIMFPMVSQIHEVHRAKGLLEECRQELLSEGYEIGEYQVGVMIEVPSAAILSEDIAKEVDFFSIGTNDLIQYTTAVDRINPLVSNLYRSADPAVMRLMKMTIVAGKKAGIWTGLCGEIASDLELLPLLVGFGLDELSVGVNKVLTVKSALRKLNYAECQQLVEEVSGCVRAVEIRKASYKLAVKYYPELMVQEGYNREGL